MLRPINGRGYRGDYGLRSGLVPPGIAYAPSVDPVTVTGVGIAEGDSDAAAVDGTVYPVGGAGAASGDSVADGIGAFTNAGQTVGTATGDAAADGIGTALVAGDGAASGDSASAGVGASTAAAPGAASGDSAAAAVGTTAITSLSYISSTTATGAGNLLGPASTTAGDVLVVIRQTGGTVSGFTDFDLNNIFWYKIADGSEGGTTLVSAGGNCVCILLRGSSAITALSTRSGGMIAVSSSGDPAQQTLDASTGTPPVAGFTVFQEALGATIDPRTTSITPTAEITSAVNFYVHVYIQNSSPADYTWDMQDEGTGNALRGQYIHNCQG